MVKEYSLPVEETLLSKKECIIRADEILEAGLITEMTTMQIARELFFHAWICYRCKKLKTENKIIKTIMNRADPIDLMDGGDTFLKRTAFFITWLTAAGRD